MSATNTGAAVVRPEAAAAGPVLVLGLPGAGKTTLAAALAAGGGAVVHAGWPGELDALALAGTIDDVRAVGADPRAAVRAVADLAAAAGGRLVVEADGLADPAPLVAALADAGTPPSRIVAVVDALHILDQLGRHPAAAEQVAFADLLLLTRTDLVRPEAIAAVRGRLAAINPSAAIVVAARGAADAETVEAAPAADPVRLAGLVAAAAARGPLDHHHEDGDRHHHGGPGHDHGHGPHDHGSHGHDGVSGRPGPGGVVSVLLSGDRPLDQVRLIDRLSALLSDRGTDVVRIKGVLDIAGSNRPLLLEGVHMLLEGRWLPAWPEGPRRSRLVVAGFGLDGHALAHAFEDCLAGPGGGA